VKRLSQKRDDYLSKAYLDGDHSNNNISEVSRARIQIVGTLTCVLCLLLCVFSVRVTELVGLAGKLSTCIREVLSPGTPFILTEVFCSFLQSFFPYFGILPRLGDDQFIRIHY
jgi:hypothetical protein